MKLLRFWEFSQLRRSAKYLLDNGWVIRFEKKVRRFGEEGVLTATDIKEALVLHASHEADCSLSEFEQRRIEEERLKNIELDKHNLSNYVFAPCPSTKKSRKPVYDTAWPDEEAVVEPD